MFSLSRSGGHFPSDTGGHFRKSAEGSLSFGISTWVDGLLSEDIVPPDNVEGGIGFVTVRSVSRAICDFGEREFDGDLFDWPLE